MSLKKLTWVLQVVKVTTIMTDNKRKKRSDADVTDYAYESVTPNSDASDNNWSSYSVITYLFKYQHEQ